eukprot:5450346-Prymnesium_polylepis.1
MEAVRAMEGSRSSSYQFTVPADANLTDPSELMGHMLQGAAFARGMFTESGTSLARVLEAAAQVLNQSVADAK